MPTPEPSAVEQDATASAVADLARRVTALVRASGVGKTATAGRDAVAESSAWIARAEVCGAPAIATFASGLEDEANAVRAALTEPWSSGQAEGQINRLKLIRRQSYRRAGLDLLQRRMVLAAWSTQNEQEPPRRVNFRSGSRPPPGGYERLRAHNAEVRQVRCRIEQMFGTAKRPYGLRRVHSLGLAKAGLQVRLAAVAYNLHRSFSLLAPAAR